MRHLGFDAPSLKNYLPNMKLKIDRVQLDEMIQRQLHSLFRFDAANEIR